MKCDACIGTTTFVRDLINNPVSLAGINLFSQVVCRLGIGEVTELTMGAALDSSNCPGLVQQQWMDFILPTLYEEVLDNKKMCTFMMAVCETDKYRAVDLEEWVDNKLSEKSPAAL